MDSLIIFSAKYLFLVSVIALGIYFFRSPKEIRISMFRVGIILLPLTYAIGLLARALYDNPRPFVVENLTPLIEHAADNGFPSDHTLLLASLASLATFFNRKLAIFLWIITLVVGASRVLAGAHHSLDILGSIIISIACAGVIYFINKQKPNATNHI